MVSGEYLNRGKENYAPNNFPQGSYNENEQEISECYDNNYVNKFFPAQCQEYESDKFDDFISSQFDTSQNEFFNQKLAYQTRNYHSQQPRCTVVQMRKQHRNSNFSEI